MALCPKCRKAIRYGSTVVQLAIGKYYPPAITPTYTDSVTLEDWHYECFPRQRLHAQSQPYFCEICFQEIENGEEILYGVMGESAGTNYKRPEHRGYELYIVVHVQCVNRDEALLAVFG
jgi:hypothetical protein